MTTTQADKDAAWGNDRITRAAFMREEMQQTSCLAIEAARRWEAQSKPV